VHSPHFDRLAGVRRNRRLRNFWMIAGVASLFFVILLSVDPLFSGAKPKLGLILVCGGALVISASAATYFHLRFLTRE
jgi:hypothetical protein